MPLKTDTPSTLRRRLLASSSGVLGMSPAEALTMKLKASTPIEI